MDLSAKTVLLTGASKGIGAAIAKVLCAQGAHVVAHYGGDRAGAEDATAGAAEGRSLLVGADLADPLQVDRLWNEAVSWRGRVDAIVNNAAVMEMNGGIENDEAEWEAAWASSMAVNVAAPMRLMRHAARHYLEHDGGTIVTLSSWAAQRGSGQSRHARLFGLQGRRDGGDQDNGAQLRPSRHPLLRHRARRGAHPHVGDRGGIDGRGAGGGGGPCHEGVGARPPTSGSSSPSSSAAPAGISPARRWT